MYISIILIILIMITLTYSFNIQQLIYSKSPLSVLKPRLYYSCQTSLFGVVDVEDEWEWDSNVDTFREGGDGDIDGDVDHISNSNMDYKNSGGQGGEEEEYQGKFNELRKMRVAELKDGGRGKGMRVGGRKDELIERILEKVEKERVKEEVSEGRERGKRSEQSKELLGILIDVANPLRSALFRRRRITWLTTKQ